MKYKILVVDDEPANTRLLERLLRGEFEVVPASSGAEALGLLSVHDIALIISDQRMPSMTGIELLKRSADVRPHCVRMIITGYTDVNALVDAINSGVVYKYVTKPWSNAELLLTVKRALSHYETIKAQHKLNLEYQRLWDRLRSTEACVTTLCMEMIRMRDAEWPQTAVRVRDLARSIGAEMGMEPEELDSLASAAYLYRIADLFVSDETPGHEGSISDEAKRERCESRERSLEMLEEVPGFADAAMYIRFHFERFDGVGSGHGLSGAKIPLASRILAAARMYEECLGSAERTGSHHTAAGDAVRSMAGKQLDPDIVGVLSALAAMDRCAEPVELLTSPV